MTSDGVSGRLAVVGTGMQLAAHIAPLAASHIQSADKVLYMIPDGLASLWIRQHGRDAESVGRFYARDKPRAQTYEEMVEHVLSFVRAGKATCLAAYGHPGVFAYPTHESIRRARAEGFPATMVPGISAEDCLFADLGIDPADHGCQSYEATDFLIHGRRIDVTSGLVLWQIGVVGNLGYAGAVREDAFAVLLDTLIERYGPEHRVAVYVASPHPVVEPQIRRVALRELPATDVTPESTLYVPPLRAPRIDRAMVRRLGLEFAFPANGQTG